MVELPAETSYLPDAAEEAKAVKAVALVKGITPAAPAPIVAEKVEPTVSLFARIKNFFAALGSKTNEEKAEEKAAESRREGNRNRNDRNRGERGEKNAAQQDRPNRNTEAKAQEPRQADNKGQEQRQQKPQQPRNDVQRNQPANATAEVNATDASEQRTERSGRRNRNNRRGRRDRDENVARENNRPFVPNDEIGSAAANVAVETTTAPKAVIQAVIDEKPAPASVATEATPVKAEATVTTETKKAKPQKSASKKTTANEPVQEVAKDQTEPAVDTVEKTAKADKKRPARARKPKADAKPVDLAAAGLQLVETKAEAVKVIMPVEAEKPAKPRKAASWQKTKAAEASSEPLVMVETQNK
jgi:ribonuclease E